MATGDPVGDVILIMIAGVLLLGFTLIKID